jgi:hypothetical protein
MNIEKNLLALNLVGKLTKTTTSKSIKMTFRKIIYSFVLLFIIFFRVSFAQMPAISAPPNTRPAQQTQPQATPIPVPQQPKPLPKEDFTWWYLLISLLILGLIGAIYWLVTNKNKEKIALEKEDSGKKKKGETGAIDSDNELEWLRKNQELIDRRKKRHSQISSKAKLPNSKILGRNGQEVVVNTSVKEVQILSKKDLPIYQIRELEMSNPFQPLTNSNDESLLGAIEQINDEFEEDENVRDLAIRILTMFKTRNSVESLAQVALYDLSTSLRVKAVITLSEFDHESVFETLLLSCADPTREVRAAAARALTKVSFDRADAWVRIAECGEDWRMVHAARAAIESGFVARYFDRLISNDYKQVYEAFAFFTLLIRAGETALIFDAINNYKDKDVQLALLQVVKVNQDPRCLTQLHSIAAKQDLPQDYGDAVDETIHFVGKAVEAANYVM